MECALVRRDCRTLVQFQSSSESGPRLIVFDFVPTSSFYNFLLSFIFISSPVTPLLLHSYIMATERLSSILNHLTPSKSGLSAM